MEINNKTLTCSISDIIGQMRIELADKELERLAEQGDETLVKDITPELYCYDEYDEKYR